MTTTIWGICDLGLGGSVIDKESLRSSAENLIVSYELSSALCKSLNNEKTSLKEPGMVIVALLWQNRQTD